MRYTYRCPEHGDFEVELAVDDTEPTHPCPYHYGDDHPELYGGRFCRADSPKVLNGNIIFKKGRAHFHNT